MEHKGRVCGTPDYSLQAGIGLSNGKGKGLKVASKYIASFWHIARAKSRAGGGSISSRLQLALFEEQELILASSDCAKTTGHVYKVKR